MSWDRHAIDAWSRPHITGELIYPPDWLSIGSPWPSLYATAAGVQVHLPNWLVVVLLVAPILLLWRLDRRRPQPGHCRCGYDLTGNTSGRCPECGHTVTHGETRPRSA